MKKLILCLLAMILSLTFIPLQLNGSVAESTTMTASKPVVPADSSEVKVLLSRLEEIKAIDKKDLKSSERKELRKEAKSISQEIRHTHGGLYISGSAVIIVLLLIIIL